MIREFESIITAIQEAPARREAFLDKKAQEAKAANDALAVQNTMAERAAAAQIEREEERIRQLEDRKKLLFDEGAIVASFLRTQNIRATAPAPLSFFKTVLGWKISGIVFSRSDSISSGEYSSCSYEVFRQEADCTLIEDGRTLISPVRTLVDARPDYRNSPNEKASKSGLAGIYSARKSMEINVLQAGLYNHVREGLRHIIVDGQPFRDYQL